MQYIWPTYQILCGLFGVWMLIELVAAGLSKRTRRANRE